MLDSYVNVRFNLAQNWAIKHAAFWWLSPMLKAHPVNRSYGRVMDAEIIRTPRVQLVKPCLWVISTHPYPTFPQSLITGLGCGSRSIFD